MAKDDEQATAELRLRALSLDTTAAEVELDKQHVTPRYGNEYPNRPRNQGKALLFSSLIHDLFDPLIENGKRSKRKIQQGPSGRQAGPNSRNGHGHVQVRDALIDRYISRWRKEVGNDLFPVMRLIMPDKDRHRAMYGIKEKALAKFLIKVLKIDKNSDDGFNLMNWKHHGRGEAGQQSGDFANRAGDVLSKRPFRTKPGHMTIDDVNVVLDKLSSHPKEEDQITVIDHFYRHMNPEELKWLLCIILRIMHVGAGERTFLSIFHPDAERLFNICSDLRRVCFDLWSPNIRLEREGQGVHLKQCFQPQLASREKKSLKDIVNAMQTVPEGLEPPEDPTFWIEEKLDGERMQMHVWRNSAIAGGREFKFWSRKAKDYTYLYGQGTEDKQSALTAFLKDAFPENVDNIILDGEMVAWDMETDKIVPFGTLKTAALSQQNNQYADGQRPVFRVFDILYFNDTDITQYTLRDRRKALDKVVKPVHRRLELLPYSIGRTVEDIEDALRRVVENASEGLVMKNPLSPYKLNDRNNFWVKAKPEYMEEFGESLECLIIGGYYGSGKRGGGVSSYLLGLRVDRFDKPDKKSQKYLSFCKVGGGMTTDDYKEIAYRTEGKWIDWERSNPPTEYIELGGGVQYQRERPDVWIKPTDSIVMQAKAAEVVTSDEFAMGLTLRFPRFQKLRLDKDWTSALTEQDFLEVKAQAETEKINNEEAKKKRDMNVEQRRKKMAKTGKRALVVAGYSERSVNQIDFKAAQDDESSTNVFKGLTFYVLSESPAPHKKTKSELEQMIKFHGGQIVQTAKPPPSSRAASETADSTPPELILISNRRTVPTVSLVKKGDLPLLKPIWLFDTIAQARVEIAYGFTPMPLRPEMERHLFYAPEERVEMYEQEVDRFGDSYARDTTVEELRAVMAKMGNVSNEVDGDLSDVRDLISSQDTGDEPVGWILTGTVLYFADDAKRDEDGDVEMDGISGASGVISARVAEAKSITAFAGAHISDDLEDLEITHVIVDADPKNTLDSARVRRLRTDIMNGRRKLPRIVKLDWVFDSWKEKTRLDEERYAVY